MNNVLHELLRIKDFRETQAESRVRRQRTLVQQAHEKHVSEKNLLERLLIEGQETELRLYRELCERQVRVRDIEDVQHQVVGLRQRESLQQEAVISAQELEHQAEEALSAAKTLHQEAQRQKGKFEDLSRDFDMAEAQESERKEDLELEEVASFRRDREDWEGQDDQLEASI